MFTKHYIELEKWRPVFKTTDGIVHYGSESKWAKVSGLCCTIGEYLMIDIVSNGYIEEDNGTMYPMTNVLSVNWEQVDRTEVKDKLPEFNIFFTDSDIKKYV